MRQKCLSRDDKILRLGELRANLNRLFTDYTILYLSKPYVGDRFLNQHPMNILTNGLAAQVAQAEQCGGRV